MGKSTYRILRFDENKCGKNPDFVEVAASSTKRVF